MAVKEFQVFQPSAKIAGVPSEPIWRLSVEQYHEMIETGILHEGDPIELLDGWLVYKMTKNPPHETATGLIQDVIAPLLPKGWILRLQAPITLSDSEPEPDAAIVRGKRQDYAHHHPSASDVAVVIEVSDSTFQRDRELKQRIYARAGISAYWIVNLVEGQIEIYTRPQGAAGSFSYAERRVYHGAEQIEFNLDNRVLGTMSATDLLP